MNYLEKKEDVLKRIHKVAIDCFGFKDQIKVTVKENEAYNITNLEKTIKIILEAEDNIFVPMVELNSFYIQTQNSLISYRYVFERSILCFKMENKNTISFEFAINHIYGINTPNENEKLHFTIA